MHPDPKEDLAVRTVACVVSRIKTDNPPWQTLAKTGEQGLVKQLLKFLGLMIETPSVSGVLEMRRAAPGVHDEQEEAWGSVGAWAGHRPGGKPTGTILRASGRPCSQDSRSRPSSSNW